MEEGSQEAGTDDFALTSNAPASPKAHGRRTNRTEPLGVAP